MSANTTAGDGVVYWALNSYGVTGFDLLLNAILLLVAGWVISLNLLVLYALLKQVDREPTDIFVCGLASADALSGFYLIYSAPYNLANYQFYYECVFRLGFIQIVGLSSVYHMAALTFDRFVKIVYPYHYTTVCNKVSVAVVSVAIWGVSILVGILPMVGWNRKYGTDASSDEPVCGYFVVLSESYLTFLIVLFWAPLFVMAVVYGCIFKIALRHARVIKAQVTFNKQTTLMERHSWKYTKTVFIMVGIYLLTWIPTGTVIMMELRGHLDSQTPVEKGNLLLYVSASIYVNSLVNPIIYAFKITAVRKRFKRIFCRLCSKPGVEDVEHSIRTVGTQQVQ